jgi:hypothetical protein
VRGTPSTKRAMVVGPSWSRRPVLPGCSLHTASRHHVAMQPASLHLPISNPFFPCFVVVTIPSATLSQLCVHMRRRPSPLLRGTPHAASPAFPNRSWQPAASYLSPVRLRLPSNHISQSRPSPVLTSFETIMHRSLHHTPVLSNAVQQDPDCLATVRPRTWRQGARRGWSGSAAMRRPG